MGKLNIMLFRWFSLDLFREEEDLPPRSRRFLISISRSIATKKVNRARRLKGKSIKAGKK